MYAYTDAFDMTWIGMRRSSDILSNYTWIDGTPLDYSKWRVGEPNNQEEIESCVQLLTINPERYNQTWNDIECDMIMRSFVCKRIPM